VGVPAAIVSLLVSLHVIVRCTKVPAAYAAWRTAWCGTGLPDLDAWMMVELPLLLGIAGAGCWLARRIPFGRRFARCAFLIAVGTWLLTLITLSHHS
jgi:hypothetical protein